jgi:hypothetical protein
MAKKPIRESGNNFMYHHTGVTRFSGCQCIKDCTCNEDFKPRNYDFFSVVRKGKKTTIHTTESEAIERFEFVCSLQNTTQL